VIPIRDSMVQRHKRTVCSNLLMAKTDLLVKRHVLAYWDASSVSLGFLGCTDLWVLPSC